MSTPVLDLAWSDWLALFGHFMSLSLMAVGAAFSTLPEMHRYLVDRQHWLTDPQFSASITLAQAAPGPNVLFVALMGWNVGMNAGGYGAALLGALVCLVGMLLPSSLLVYFASHWGQRNRDRRAVRAFKQGMGPVVIALLIGTGWIMARAQGETLDAWPVWALTAATTVIVWRTRIHLLWLLGTGAVLGALGGV
ncbi:MAG: chromate transporter [Propionivibrio sp.]